MLLWLAAIFYMQAPGIKDKIGENTRSEPLRVAHKAYNPF